MDISLNVNQNCRESFRRAEQSSFVLKVISRKTEKVEIVLQELPKLVPPTRGGLNEEDFYIIKIQKWDYHPLQTSLIWNFLC